MSSVSAFWLGLALSLPVGIGVNLATPWIQRRVSVISRHRRAKFELEQARERDFAETLAHNLDEFVRFSVASSLRAAAYIGAFLITLGAIWLVSNVVFDLPDYVSSDFYEQHYDTFQALGVAEDFLSNIVWLVGGILILNAVRPPIRVIRLSRRIRSQAQTDSQGDRQESGGTATSDVHRKKTAPGDPAL